MRKVMVTGATGYIGSHLAHYLADIGFEVIALVRDLDRAKDNPLLKNIKKEYFNLSDSKSFPLINGAALYHCAWDNVRDVWTIQHIEKNLLENYSFINWMVENGCKNIIVTGSCFEYGLQYGPVTVKTPTAPNTPYALAKDSLHKMLVLLQKEIEFKLIWSRIFYLYGDNQNNTSVISQLDAAIERGDPVFNMSLGEQLLDYLSIDEVVKQLAQLMNTQNGTYNICSGSPISLRRLLEKRIDEKSSKIKLNLGYYPYRKEDSMAIWGSDPVAKSTSKGEVL